MNEFWTCQRHPLHAFVLHGERCIACGAAETDPPGKKTWTIDIPKPKQDDNDHKTEG